MKKDIESRIRIACLKEKIRSYEDPLAKDECESRIRSIKEAWEDIKSANDAPFLDDERISRLNGYADIKCLDADDNEVPLLGDEELQAITVKKGTLTASERKTVESHVVYTSRMLSQMNFKGIYKEVPFWAGAHHEFLDGSGYPERLGENDLPNEARLLTIIDIYDALTAEDRPYKPPMEPQKAFGILKSMSEEGKLDGQILDMFIESKAWVRS